MTLEIDVVEDPARACAALLLSAVMAGGHVVLTGGSTPRRAYEELAEAVRELDVDLGETEFWFGDERCVPPDDERSNYRMVREVLFDPLQDPTRPAVHRIQGELGHERAAEAYEEELREAGALPFELVLLGLGPTVTRRRCFLTSPRWTSAPAWSWESPRPGTSPSCPG